MPRGTYKIATQETKLFLAGKECPDALLHQPETYQRYFARLYGTLGPNSADDDPAYFASKEFNFPAAAKACQLIEDETRSVLVPYGRGGELIETIRHQQYLTADLARRCPAFHDQSLRVRVSEVPQHGCHHSAAQGRIHVFLELQL